MTLSVSRDIGASRTTGWDVGTKKTSRTMNSPARAEMTRPHQPNATCRQCIKIVWSAASRHCKVVRSLITAHKAAARARRPVTRTGRRRAAKWTGCRPCTGHRGGQRTTEEVSELRRGPTRPNLTSLALPDFQSCQGEGLRSDVASTCRYVR